MARESDFVFDVYFIHQFPSQLERKLAVLHMTLQLTLKGLTHSGLCCT